MSTRLLAACLLVAACATGRGATRGTGTNIHYTLPGPGAAEYRTEPADGEALTGPHAAAVGRGITRAAQQQTLALAPDARLARLAAWVAEASEPDGSPPPNDAIDLMARHVGLYEPAPHLLVLTQSDPATLEERVTRELAELMPQQRYTHYGAATLDRKGTTYCVVALSWRWLALLPLARVVEPGAALRLQGTLLPGFEAAQLVVAYPDGSSFRSDPQSGAGIGFALPLRGRGEHRVELLANSALGDTVVANFPLYVGVPAKTEISVVVEGTRVSPQSEREAQERLLALINADRKRAGLAPVALHVALARVARGHSQDMQAHAFIGHTSPTTGGPADRAKRAGIRSPLLLENIGRGYGAEEVHRGLMESPGHRENVLNRQATHVGIGVVLEREDLRTAYLVTELFGRFAARINVDAAPDDLLASINRARARRGARPLALDRTMAGLCAQTASQVFSEGPRTRQALVEQLNRKAAGARLPYPRLSALLTLITGLDEAERLDALLDPSAKAVGIAMAQGTRGDTFDNAIAVVVLIGY